MNNRFLHCDVINVKVLRPIISTYMLHLSQPCLAIQLPCMQDQDMCILYT